MPKAMKKIYDFLGEEYYEHSSEVKQSYNVNDEEIYKLKDMHTIRSEIKKTSQDPKDVLPETILTICDTNEVLQKYENLRKKSMW
jgi:hypothetical protein